MLQPVRTKYRKAFKGRIHGNAARAVKLNYGQFGLKAIQPDRVISKQIEADSIALLDVFQSKEFLKNNNFNKETALGMYIANSYEFFWNTSAEDFRDRMLKEYNNFWNEERLTKAEQVGLSKDQVISLAAIVQKETVKICHRQNNGKVNDDLEY